MKKPPDPPGAFFDPERLCYPIFNNYREGNIMPLEPLTWVNMKCKIGDLIPWPRNPRLIYEDQGRRLVKSYKEFNQAETILIEPGGEPGKYGLLNGHQRLKVWGTEFGPDLEVDCRLSNRKLTEKEKEKLTIYLHKGTTGEFDMELLSSWNVSELLEWGFKKLELGMAGDEGDLSGIGGAGADDERDGDAPEGEENPPSSGELLAMTNITIAEPAHTVTAGDVWRLGHHVLICVSVITGWQSWVHFLEDGSILVPYPGPYVALSDRAEEYRMVLVQPDPYIAGHILDRYAEIGGEELVSKVAQ